MRERSGRWMRVITFCSGLLVFACVTINIYFPAEKVESVAGEIVRDVRGPKTEEENDQGAKENSLWFQQQRPLLASLTAVAMAQEVTTISNPTIRELKNQMKARFPQLKPWFDKGVFSEGDDGYLSVNESAVTSIRDKGLVRNLAAAENNDRNKLYGEVAKALDIDPGQVDRVARIFAKEWQKSLQP